MSDCKKEQGKSLEGSLTIEASLVMSWVILVIFTFILLTIWFCDRMTVGAVLREGVELGRYRNEAALYTWVEEEMGQLFLAEGSVKEIEAGDDRAILGWESHLFRIYPGGYIRVSETVEREFIDAPSFLLRCRVAESLFPLTGE